MLFEMDGDPALPAASFNEVRGSTIASPQMR